MAAASVMSYTARDGFDSYSQQYAIYQTRSNPSNVDMTQGVHPDLYTTFTPSIPSNPPYPQSADNRSGPGSGSPTSDDGTRPSLPPISNLLGIVQGGRRVSGGPLNHATDSSGTMARSPLQRQTINSASTLSTTGTPQDVSRSPVSGLQPPPPPPSIPAPAPPRNDSVMNSTNNTSRPTGLSLTSHPYPNGHGVNNNGEAIDQRAVQAQFMKPRVHSQPSISSYARARYRTSSYTPSPSALSNPAYYASTIGPYPLPLSDGGLYNQRPLPSNFPPLPPPPLPVVTPVVASTPGAATGNPWEHHHYISASSQASYPQSQQDRYVCPTCNKAFSRPSSLKIHSHSHTGEKPFRCPHVGCGKAFSVRSNMKRHERGCHSAMAAAAAAAAAAVQIHGHPPLG